MGLIRFRQDSRQRACSARRPYRHGGHGAPLEELLRRPGCRRPPLALLNPLKARRFQDSGLERTKTDATDATGLARFAFERRPSRTARRALAGHEAMAMIRKGQVWKIGGRDTQAQATLIAALVVAAAWPASCRGHPPSRPNLRRNPCNGHCESGLG